MPAKNFRSRLGILRSRIMYYGKPFNRRRLRKFYSAFVPKGGLCFDIGAHLGNRIAPFLDLGAQIVAVEPQPLCLEYLQRRYGKKDSVTNPTSNSARKIKDFMSEFKFEEYW